MVFGTRGAKARAKAAAASSSQPAQPLPTPTPEQLDPTETDPEFQPDPEARRYEAEAGFEMPWGFQFRNYMRLRKRPFEHTRFMDLETLERFGVAEQFIELASKVGILPDFWNFREYAYKGLTLEFLCSLKLMSYDGRDYIVYRLGNYGRRAWLDELSAVFHLENGTVEKFIYTRDPNHEVTRESIWQYLCGKSQKLQSRHVQHPTLRVLLRGISATVFARGETVNLAQDKDIGFLWHMLQPEPEKLNVMKIMVKHWISQREMKHGKGNISMGSFVTILAKRLEVPLPSRTTCTGYTHYDDERFAAASFIKIYNIIGRPDDRYLWLRDKGSDFYLPYPERVNVSNPYSWLIPHDYVKPRAPIEMQQPTPMETDAAGPSERPISPPRVPSYQETYPQAPPWATDLMSMVGNLSRLTMENNEEVKRTREDVRKGLEIQADYGMQLSHLSNEFLQFGKRLDSVSSMTFDNNYYLIHGNWPQDEEDPIPTPSYSSVPSAGTYYSGRSTGSSSHSAPPPPQEQAQPTESFEAEDHFDNNPDYGEQQGGPYGGGNPYGSGGPYDGYNPYGGGGYYF